MLLLIIFVIAGFAALMGGAEFLVRGGSSLALRFGISPLVVGLTIVALGTSAPELVTCVTAALRGSSSLALGNVIGSNICNIGLILGFTALYRPIEVHSRVVKFDSPLVIAISLLLVVFLLDHMIARWEAAIFLVGTFLFTYWMIRMARSGVELEIETPEGKTKSVWLDVMLILCGAILLAVGGHLLVEGAKGLARLAGVSEAIIGLSLVAFGTSVPELATCMVAARKGEADLAVGNIMGSNVYNIIFILGASGVIQPMDASEITWTDISVMILFAVAVLPIMFTQGKIVRWEGGLLLTGYLAYVAFLFIQS